MDTSSRISKIRSRERERLRGPPWLKVYFHLVCLDGGFFNLDSVSYLLYKLSRPLFHSSNGMDHDVLI